MLKNIQSSRIAIPRSSFNTNSCFDTTYFRNSCVQYEILNNIIHNKCNGYQCGFFFDEFLYRQRFVVERTIAEVDVSKALLVRFEKKVDIGYH